MTNKHTQSLAKILALSLVVSIGGSLGCTAGQAGSALTAEQREAASAVTAPSIPSVAQPAGEAALALSWSPQTSGFVAIDRSWPGCGGTCYKNVLWSNTPVSQWTDTTVSYDVPYRYKVYNSAGHNGYSAPVTPDREAVVAPPAVTPPAVTPPTGPSAPSLPTVAQVGSDAALALSWSGGDGGFVAVDRSWPGCGGTCYQNVLWSNTPRNGWTDTTVSYDVPYRYKVYNSLGNSGYSASVTAVEDPGATPPTTGTPGTMGTTESVLPAGEWDLAWSDDFDGASGASPAAHWINGPAWAAGPRPGTHSWRDAVSAPEECYLDGTGHLVLRARYVDGERRVCYLSTADNPVDPSQWTTFGPGAKGVYIEYRANVSQMRAHASWFAMWLMSPDNTYDGNPATGSEIDVMEYVPFEGPQYSLNNLFHAAVFWDLSGGKAEPAANPPLIDAYGQISAPTLGADLTADTYHTWGIEWYEGEQRFYFNGQQYWKNTTGVSNADNHGIRLTIEVDNGDPYNLWGHPVGAFEDNPSSRLPSYARIDHVRVFRKR